MVEKAAMGTSPWYISQHRNAGAGLLRTARRLRGFHGTGSSDRIGKFTHWAARQCEGEVQRNLILRGVEQDSRCYCYCIESVYFAGTGDLDIVLLLEHSYVRSSAIIQET